MRKSGALPELLRRGFEGRGRRQLSRQAWGDHFVAKGCSILLHRLKPTRTKSKKKKNLYLFHPPLPNPAA
jgi:hypothetical protein